MSPSRVRDAALWMVLAQVLFAGMSLSARLTAADLPWAEVGAARFFVGGLVALAIARARGASLRIPPEQRKVMWLRSALGTLAALSTFYAFGSRLALGDAATIMAMSPVFIALLSWPLLGERVDVRVALASAISLVGVVFVVRPTFNVALDGGLASLSSAIFGALAMLSLRRMRGAGSSEAIVVHFAAVATVVLVAIALPSWVVPTARGALGLAATGIFGGVAQVAMTRAYALAPAAQVAALGYLSVVLTRLLAVPIFHEQPTLPQLAGSFLVIGAGTALALSAQTRAVSPEAPPREAHGRSK